MSAAKQARPVGVFAFGWILALTLVPFVTNSDLPTSVKATLTTLLVVVCPKIFLIGAIAILGKPGFAYIKGAVMSFFRKVGPPDEVGPWRFVRQAKAVFPEKATAS